MKITGKITEALPRHLSAMKKAGKYGEITLGLLLLFASLPDIMRKK